jgi:hypothetical protein
MRGPDSRGSLRGLGVRWERERWSRGERRSGRDAIHPSDGGVLVGSGFRACLFGIGFGSLDKSLRFVPYWVVPT